MNTMDRVKNFLESCNYSENREKEPGWFPFITVSRQAGAGGHTFGEALLQAMKKDGREVFKDWQLFDRELCWKVAEEPDLKVSMASLLRSEYHSEIEDMVSELVAGNSPQDMVVKRTFGVMRTLAALGRVILVGRGGSCLLRDMKHGVHIRLVAPLKQRIARMQELLKVDEKKAREAVAERDKARAVLVRTFFDRDVEDPLLYDVTWNTAEVAPSEIARCSLELILSKSRAGQKMSCR